MACFCTLRCFVKVWELEQDYSWSLLHVTCFPPILVRDCIVEELLMTGGRNEIVDMGGLK